MREGQNARNGSGSVQVLSFAVLAVVAVVAVAGCAAVGPDYSPPRPAVPEQWRNAEPAVASADSVRLERWWQVFDDAGLSDLMARAIAANPDVEETLSRVEVARLQRHQAGSSQLPAIDAAGSAKKSEHRSADGRSTGTESYSAGLDAGWEIDVFGGIRRGIEAADADYQASIEELHDVIAVLLAEVGLSYIDLRSSQSRLAVARADLVARQQSFELIESASRAGREDELALAQARAGMATAHAAIPALESGVESVLNRLAVLLGEQAGTLHRELGTAQPVPRAAALIAIGVPAEVVRQRPDIRRAERVLAAETARVGVAEAARYPRFSLGGSIGLESLSLGDLLASPARSWSIGPAISWSMFDAGTLHDAVLIQDEVQRQALFRYESAVLAALEEVENALVAYAKEEQRQQWLGQALVDARTVSELVEQRYTGGLSDFSEVVDARRSLLSLEDQSVQSAAAASVELIRLYQALGGGWQTFDQVAYQSRSTTLSGNSHD
jgi:outer membrane protein, multidrug efflux system